MTRIAPGLRALATLTIRSVGDRMSQVETAGGIASDIRMAVDARHPSGHVGGLEDLTLNA